MSLINAAAPYRRDDRHAVRIPVVMPLVQVEVDGKGFQTVALDHDPNCADGSLTRSDREQVLDEIAVDLGTALRVEVHEVNGNNFADIFTPTRPRLRMVNPVREARTRIGKVTGGGFLAGEDVAAVVTHKLTSSDGTTSPRLSPTLLDADQLFQTAQGCVGLHDQQECIPELRGEQRRAATGTDRAQDHHGTLSGRVFGYFLPTRSKRQSKQGRGSTGSTALTSSGGRI